MNDNDLGESVGRSQAEAAWERFLIAEQRGLVARAEGILARALLKELPEESREELDRWAEEDQRLAREGLVELMDEEGKTYHKHIDQLEPWDAADRLRAETAHFEWLAKRTRERIGRQDARRLLGGGQTQRRKSPISRREPEALKGVTEGWLDLEEIVSEEVVSEDFASEEVRSAAGGRYRCVVDGCDREVVVVRASREEAYEAPPSCHGRQMRPVLAPSLTQGFALSYREPETDASGAKEPRLSAAYYLDATDPDVLVLRRQDGTFVAVFSVQGVSREGIVQAAKEDCADAGGSPLAAP